MGEVRFSHVPDVTDYMRIVVRTVCEFFGNDIAKAKILDLPAGNGWISSQLAEAGATAVPADINDERPDFVPANMERDLPFANEEFDCVICAEGIEHVLRPEALFSELARVLKKGGVLIITTPNVQNLYSRYQLACTGYLFQFDPFHQEARLKTEGLFDRGHVSPVFYTQLRYFSDLHGLKTLQPDGGRFKRKILGVLFAPLLLIGYWWAWRDWKRTSGDPGSKEIIRHLFSATTLFSRSLIFKAVKQ
ncbi:MAG TPA: class I SAM-dependent methyltransferase [Gallionella sp.]|nr:class I SAM-dependent methyltransferase [Gallionella sp.]